jgi:hypothetical protein
LAASISSFNRDSYFCFACAMAQSNVELSISHLGEFVNCS